MIDVLLNNKCGKYLTYRDFIECGETQEKLAIPNAPIQKETINALYELSINILDPVIEKFGDIHLTYGLCTHELGKKIKQRVAPKLDQHASNELNKKGQLICTRLGAAVDFIIPDMNMRVVANWIATRTPFDRLYFYGDDRPIHVSYGPDNKQDYVDLVRSLNGRQIPKNNKAYKERKSRISEIYKNIMGVCDTDFIALSDQEFAELEQKILNE